MGKRIRVTKIRLGAFGAVALLAATAVGVFAYFSATGTGTTFVTTGGAQSTWAISLDAVDSALPGPVVPGGAVEGLYILVTNTAANSESLNALTAGLTTDTAGGVYNVASSAFVNSCQASWFTVSVATFGALPRVVAAGATYQGAISNGDPEVYVSMPANNGTDQSACENLEPQVTINAS